MARTISTPIQKRFSDIDIFQHVNNVSQHLYFDVGKTDYFQQLFQEDLPWKQLVVMVSNTTSYLSQIRFKDEVHVTTTCEKVGNKSFTLYQQILCHDRLCSESRTTLVAFDFQEQKSIEVPREWRKIFLED